MFSSSAFAHEVRPAYLELRQTGPDTYDALWKVPGQGENLRLGLYVELPAGCTNVTQLRGSMVNNAYSERWTVKRPGGLNGGTIHIAGLSGTAVDVLVRLERLDGTTQVTRLMPSAPLFVVEAVPGALGVARTYTVLGVEHILSGIDHLLFVLALLIITGGGWKLVKTVTAFTVSHSITLTLATNRSNSIGRSIGQSQTRAMVTWNTQQLSVLLGFCQREINWIARLYCFSRLVSAASLCASIRPMSL